MLELFRSFFKSRLGVGITLGFVGLIALAFASADVTGNRLGGGDSGDVAARVGGATIGTALLAQTVTSGLENERQKTPGLTMNQYVAGGGFDAALSDMIERAAMFEWGSHHGFAVSDRLIGSELAQVPAFAGPDGKFNEQIFRSVIGQKGLTERTVRDDVSKAMMARQLLVPAGFGAIAPQGAALRYLTLIKEKRQGTVQMLPSVAFAGVGEPDEAALQAFYKSHLGMYGVPERRTIRYAVIDQASLKDVPVPSDAEIRKRYTDNAAVYAPNETRSVTQVVLPSEAAAKEIAARGAKDLAASARAAGLAPATLANQTKQALTTQTSAAIAQAVFAAGAGQTLGPIKGPLGWYVIHVDAAAKNAGKTLDQARGEIVAALSADKRRAALSDRAVAVEERLEKGTGLADVAKELGLTLTETEPLLANSTVFGPGNKPAPDAVKPLVQTAFGMEREGQAQVAEIAKGQSFAVFDVGRITPAAPSPFAEVRSRVAADYRTDKGFAGAQAAADKLVAAIQRGTPPAEAAKALGVALPAPQPVDISREDMLKSGDRAPAALALLFNMANGTTRKLEAPGRAGWMVVSLAKIVPGEAKADDPMVGNLRGELGQAMGREWASALRVAMRTAVGVKRNATAITATRNRLVGGQ